MTIARHAPERELKWMSKKFATTCQAPFWRLRFHAVITTGVIARADWRASGTLRVEYALQPRHGAARGA